MLSIDNLHAGCEGKTILQGINLDVKPGEVHAIMGPNGSGKSTLSTVVAGHEDYDVSQGTILFEGEDITGLRSEQVVQKGIIHVPEGRRIFPNISVRENLELGSYLRGQQNRKANLDRVVGVFPRLQERFSQLAGTLSGGEQQMLAIGRGMMAEPRLMILDEPSLGLSPLLVEEMFGLIQNLNKTGLSFFLVEQNVMQSLEIANRAYVIENGKIVLSGNADALLNDPELKKSYLGV